jgi:hypothetical protein
MIAEPTDDYWWIVYNTFFDDTTLVARNHYCSPAGYNECTNHTVRDILERTKGVARFYAITEGGLLGYACLDDKRRRVFSFGIRLDVRKQGRTTEIIDFILNLGGNKNKTFLLQDTNNRDIEILKKLGYVEHSQDFYNSEKEYKLKT